MSCATDPSTSKIKFNRGNTHVVDVAVKQKDPQNSRLMIPVDLTGSVVGVLSVKSEETDVVYVAQLTGVVLSPATDGIIEFTFAPSDTQDVVPSNYVYDVRLTLPGDRIYTIIKDDLILEGTVTNPVEPVPPP